MASTLDHVIAIVAEHSGIPSTRLVSSSAIDQDIRISGDDVTELVQALASAFSDQVWEWPWQRFAELGEPSLLIVPVFIWRLVTWPFRGGLFDRSPFERLEIGHIAAALDAGGWFEP